MKHYSTLKETTVSSQTLYKGVLEARVDEVKLLNGDTDVRVYFKHQGASGVLAIEDGQVYLVQQYRYPIGQVTLEIPAGKREKWQTFAQCARAELKQEAGLTAKSVKEILVYHPCNAFSSEQLHIYLATGLSQGESQPDKDEFLNVCKIPLKKAYQMIKKGEITDGKTILALQWYQLNHK